MQTGLYLLCLCNDGFENLELLYTATLHFVQVVRTPLLESPALNAKLNCRLFVKAEVLQVINWIICKNELDHHWLRWIKCLVLFSLVFQLTGSFKYRGALNKLLSIEPQTRKHGVVAFSSGNHAQVITLIFSSHFGYLLLRLFIHYTKVDYWMFCNVSGMYAGSGLCSPETESSLYYCDATRCTANKNPKHSKLWRTCHSVQSCYGKYDSQRGLIIR